MVNFAPMSIFFRNVILFGDKVKWCKYIRWAPVSRHTFAIMFKQKKMKNEKQKLSIIVIVIVVIVICGYE